MTSIIRLGGGSAEAQEVGPEQIEIPSWTAELEGRRLPIRIPAHLDDELPRAPARYLLRTTVDLPVGLQRGPLTLVVPGVAALVSVRVEGRQAMPLDAAGPDRYRASRPPRFRVPPEVLAGRTTLALELAVEHRWSQSGWLEMAPRLSATPEGDREFLLVRGFNLATGYGALSTAVLVGFWCLVSFLLDRRRRAHGWFALEALSAALYPAFLLGLTQPVLGAYDLAVMSVGVAVASVASVYVTHAQLGLGPVHRGWPLALAVCLVAAVVSPGPFVATPRMQPFAVAVVFANVFYQVRAAVQLDRRRPLPVHPAALTVAWAVLGIGSIPDHAVALGLGEVVGGLRGGCLGIAGLALLQAVILGREHLVALRRADGGDLLAIR